MSVSLSSQKGTQWTQLFFPKGNGRQRADQKKNILNILLSSNEGRNVITSLVIWLRILWLLRYRFRFKAFYD